VSQDPFWDPSQQLDHVPIIPATARQVQVEDTPAVAHNPFADPPPYISVTVDETSSKEEAGPNRLSTLSDAPSQLSVAAPLGVAM